MPTVQRQTSYIVSAFTVIEENPSHSVSSCDNWLPHSPYDRIEIFPRGSQDFILAPLSSYLTASDLFQICHSDLHVKCNGLLVPLPSVNVCCIFVLMLEVFSKKRVFVMISVQFYIFISLSLCWSWSSNYLAHLSESISTYSLTTMTQLLFEATRKTMEETIYYELWYPPQALIIVWHSRKVNWVNQ